MKRYKVIHLIEQSGSFYDFPTAHPEERSDEGSQRSFTRFRSFRMMGRRNTPTHHLIIIIIILIVSLLSLGIFFKNTHYLNIFYKRNNKGILSFAEFKGYLYAGTWNEDRGCELWRTNTGTRWIPVVTDGFGNPVNHELLSLQLFKDYLYAGVRHYLSGAHLYRSFDGVTWKPVMTDGFGNVENIDIASLCQFKGHLYAGSKNEDLAELWKSYDGKEWRKVDIDGLTKENNIKVIYSLFVHNGYLYLGPITSETMACIYRSRNGVDWEKVSIPATSFTAYTCIIEFKNYIYAGAKSDMQKKCGGIIRTNDGKNWNEIESLPRKNRLKVDCIAVFNDELYSGVRYLSESGELRIEILKSNDGVNWSPVSSPIYASPNNTLIDCLAEFKGYLYAGLWNESEGAQIWRTEDAEIWERVY